MPSFTIDGKILLGMAAFKAHAAVNFWRGSEIGLDREAGGMGQLGKLESLDDLPVDFDALVVRAAELAASPPAPKKPKRAPKPPPALHPDFAVALDGSPAAKEALEGFPPGQKREYLDWINQAKQDSTRAKRIAQAVEWLSEGKRRHWRYENC
jgi:hypothetical protein